MDSEVEEIEVLIVDDNEMSGLLAMTYLRKSYKSKYITDPKKAINLISEYKYKVILLDLDLGAGIRGENLLKEIRLKSANIDTPVIALTGFSGNNENQTMLQSGFTAYLSKPYSKTDLLELLKTIL